MEACPKAPSPRGVDGACGQGSLGSGWPLCPQGRGATQSMNVVGNNHGTSRPRFIGNSLPPKLIYIYITTTPILADFPKPIPIGTG